MEYFGHPLLEEIMKKPLNNNCNDCGSQNPNWASVNNGVTLCLKCAGVHRGFGVQISIIRSLTMDSWEENQINILKNGGNERFQKLMIEYSVPENSTPDFKYLISATNYYRKLLRAEVLGENLPVKPDLVNGLELLDCGINTKTNITNTKPISNSTYDYRDFETKNKNNNAGLLGSIGGYFSGFTQTISNKIKESNIKEIIVNTGELALDYTKKAGTFVADKGKQAYESKIVQDLTHKAEESINVVVQKAREVFGAEVVENEQIQRNESIDSKLDASKVNSAQNNLTKENEYKVTNQQN